MSAVRVLLVLASVVIAGCADLGEFQPASSSSSGSAGQSPVLQVQQDEAADALRVVAASSGLRWDQIDVEASAPVRLALNGPVGPTSQLAGTVSSSEPVQAGDSLSFCAADLTMASVMITLRYAPSSIILGQFLFDSLAPCSPAPSSGASSSSPLTPTSTSAGPSAPSISWAVDEGTDRWTVTQVSPTNLAWFGFDLTATSSLRVALNAQPDPASQQITSSRTQIISSAGIQAGDSLRYCSSTGAATQVQVTLYHRSSNGIQFQSSFMSVAACAGSASPTISLSVDEAADRWTVVQTNTGQTWSMFDVSTTTPIRLAINGPVTTSSQLVAGARTQISSSASIQAGDTVRFCADSPGAAPNVQLTLFHRSSNSVMHQNAFMDIVPCAQPAPQMSFATDEGNDKITVVSTPTGMMWSRFDLTSSVSVRVGLNGAPTSSSQVVSGSRSQVSSSAGVQAGDALLFCATGGSGGQATLTIYDRPSNSILYQQAFMTIAVCVPVMSIQVDESNDRWTVYSTSTGEVWSNFDLAASTSLRVGLNGASGSESQTITSSRSQVSSMAGVQAGDALRFCAASGTPQAQITLYHRASNSIMFQSSFMNVAECVPDMSLNHDETNDRWTVSQTSSGLSWSMFDLEAQYSIRYALNGAPTGSSPIVSARSAISSSVGVQAADYLQFCGANGAVSNVQVTLYHRSSNSVIKQLAFIDLVACPP